MSITALSPATTVATPLPMRPSAHVSALFPPMSILRRLNLRRRIAISAAAVRQDAALWTPAPLSAIEPAAESLFHIAVDLSDSPDLAASHTRAGQYLQLKVGDSPKPTFLAIASPPTRGASPVFEFLVKSVSGSTAELLCRLRRGDLVELSSVMGVGFEVDRIQPPEKFPTVLIFATGSAIRFELETLFYRFDQIRRRHWVGFRSCNPIIKIMKL